MDGVVTDTAQLHAQCWKEVLDALLQSLADETGQPFRPFTIDDYSRYVDGRPRYDGAVAFLAARQVSLEGGDPSDPPGFRTVCGLGNLKALRFEDALAAQGVATFESTIALIRRLRSRGVRTALISSSRHVSTIVASVGIADLFDVVVDGNDAATLGLPGKPDPAIFLAAARALGVDPCRAVVVEDALAGVEAGHRGGFSMVVGVNRKGRAKVFRDHGADVVVDDLADIELGDTEPSEPR
jgi:alpha,alpha-trehalase